MAHLVEQMVYAGETPWHGLGTKIPANVSAKEALVPAGLDWTVEARPCYHKQPDGSFAEVPRFRTTVRSSDGSALGVVSKGYGVIQNAELAAVADAIAGEGNAWCHTAGSLDEGRRVWFLLQLPGQFRVGNDASPVEKYLLLNTRHDGTAAAKVLFTPVRVVCNNTLTAAMDIAEKSKKNAESVIQIRHTANVAEHLEAAKTAMRAAIDYFARFEALAQELARAAFSHEQMEGLAEHLFPGREDGTAAKITSIYRDKILALFDGGKGHEEIRGTAWAAVNAVGEFVDHHRNHRATPGSTAVENRAKAIWFGSGFDIKERALHFVKKETGLLVTA
jgi:phage/plasmid-like protein (TIGR03299 family)